jgi:hypothetical protein
MNKFLIGTPLDLRVPHRFLYEIEKTVDFTAVRLQFDVETDFFSIRHIEGSARLPV